MVESAQLEQLEQGESNINSHPFKEFLKLNCEEDKGFQAKAYFLTFHISGDDTFELAFKRIESSLVLLCERWIFAEEYGNSGDTPHIQGGFILGNKQRAKKLNKDTFLGKASLFKLKSFDYCYHYCMKESGRKISSEKIYRPKVFLEQEQLNAWELFVDNICENVIPDDRTIYWLYSKKGNMGKTTFCKFLTNKYKACIIGGKDADNKNCVVNYIQGNIHRRAPELVILPIPKSFGMEYVSYTSIEMVKDMFFYSGKYEGGQVNDNSPHIFVFANEYPNINKIMRDRWCIIEILDKEGNYKHLKI